ncbi:hypothetical protein I6H52_04540 [Corynebacterium urealyticum]|uniref:DUF7302 family protein n=1 Tax=Corynebacterium urealyticum TaxID=43771 RepID=UPI00191027A3|nr:hypothetical protein [Corynebacterium urealyticum]QQE51608.1 hypothetical protein I6H52_04540 [Corynebacterium urealyticum]
MRIQNTTTGTICHTSGDRAQQLIAEGHWQPADTKPKTTKTTTRKTKPKTTKATANPTGGAV